MQHRPSRRTLLTSTAALAVLAVAGSAQADPAATGDRICEIWMETLEKTVALTEGYPPGSEISAEFDAIKEEAVQQLVALGHEVAAMSDGDRATVEAKVSSFSGPLALNPTYLAYYDAQKKYYETDKDFFGKLKAVNIITQYAFFDLLRKQEPAEADRLGV